MKVTYSTYNYILYTSPIDKVDEIKTPAWPVYSIVR